MVHMFMIIDCKKCKTDYCTGCHEICPNCGEKDITDAKSMAYRKRVFEYTKKYKKSHPEQFPNEQ